MNQIILVISILLFTAVFFNKIGNKFGVPSLVIFIFVGILAGSEGIGGIKFENYFLAQFFGIIAISYILFMGGLSIDLKKLKPVVAEGLTLATFGVLVTGIVVAVCSYYFLHIQFLECLLLGAIVSSTDAAAVFGVLRAKNISLKNRIKPLLEFESGSNDPMAVFLTLGCIGLIKHELNIHTLFIDFLKEMTLGIAVGYFSAKALVFIINRIKIDYAGLYAVITLAGVLFTYSFTETCGGSGFIAVYTTGLVMSGEKFLYKKMITKFHDATAWIMQIVMFLLLGLLVNFKEGFMYKKEAFFIALVLIFIARPAAVFLTTFPFKRNFKEKLLISWVGLRGAAPIVLATFPLTRKIAHAGDIFNIVFFVVIISVLVQGTTIPFIARKLKLDEPVDLSHKDILEYDGINTNNTMIRVKIPKNCPSAGKRIFELNLPAHSVIGLIYKKGEYIVPTGDTYVEENDLLFVLSDLRNEEKIKTILCEDDSL